jgi:DNA-directed RNA polymerase subunit RPC12/RpoP
MIVACPRCGHAPLKAVWDEPMGIDYTCLKCGFYFSVKYDKNGESQCPSGNTLPKKSA